MREETFPKQSSNFVFEEKITKNIASGLRLGSGLKFGSTRRIQLGTGSGIWQNWVFDT